MDTIWRNAAKKMRTRAASRITAISTTTTVKNLPAASPTAFDPETGTLEELEQMSQRLQRDWPKEDGIPFPPDMLKTLRVLRAAVIARDARKRPMTAETPEQPASAEPVEAAAETASKKAEKKRRLRKKRATAHTTASPTAITNPPATTTIVSNPQTTADCSSNQIGTDIATAAPNTSSDRYNTAHPEQLHSLLTAAAPTMLDVTPYLCKTDPNPADYSLADIKEVLTRVRKRHGQTGTPILESIQEITEALKRAVRARDATVSPQTITKPITVFEPNTTPIPAPSPLIVEIPTPAPAHTPNSNLITTFELDTATPTPISGPCYLSTLKYSKCW
jgi:hypothetical protein